jgi:transcriptional regulator with XRE-family HTH domain
MPTTWTTCFVEEGDVDLEVLEEAALAMAQSTIETCRLNAGMSRSDLATKMGRGRPFVTKILKGDYNLTIRTMARALGACGMELQFGGVPVRWAQPVEPNVLAVIEASPHEGDAVFSEAA